MGWQPGVTFRELARLMAEADLCEGNLGYLLCQHLEIFILKTAQFSSRWDTPLLLKKSFQ